MTYQTWHNYTQFQSDHMYKKQKKERKITFSLQPLPADLYGREIFTPEKEDFLKEKKMKINLLQNSYCFIFLSSIWQKEDKLGGERNVPWENTEKHLQPTPAQIELYCLILFSIVAVWASSPNWRKKTREDFTKILIGLALREYICCPSFWAILNKFVLKSSLLFITLTKLLQNL